MSTTCKVLCYMYRVRHSPTQEELGTCVTEGRKAGGREKQMLLTTYLWLKRRLGPCTIKRKDSKFPATNWSKQTRRSLFVLPSSPLLSSYHHFLDPPTPPATLSCWAWQLPNNSALLVRCNGTRNVHQNNNAKAWNNKVKQQTALFITVLPLLHVILSP